MPPFPTKRMLGIDFFVGTAAEAIAHISKYGGLIVAPAAPSFIALQDDPDYRRAIADADLAIADSGWAVLFWRLLRHEKLTRISGLALFKALLETADARIPGNLFWILPSEKAKTKTLEFGRVSGYPITNDDCYVAPNYQKSEDRGQRSDLVGQAFLPAEQTDSGKRERLPYTSSLSGAAAPPLPGGEGRVRAEQAPTPSAGIEDPKLVSIIEQRKPKHIVIGIGRGNAGQARQLLKTSIDLSTRNLLHRSCARFRHRRSNRHSDVGGSIFCRLDIPDHRPTARLLNSLLARFLPLLIIKYGTRIPQLRTS
jgi:hypothetical protein